MAGTCPHCSTKISGQLRTCPSCGSYCLMTQETCPECEQPLEPVKASSPNPSPEKEQKKEANSLPPRRKKGRKKKAILWGSLLVAIILCGAGCYYYNQQRMQQKEQTDYERLADVTNPEFYQQFLIDYPESQHCDEIRERMLVLQEEAKDWQMLQRNINRTSVTLFLQKHPGSLRQRLCEDMLDSIDWQDAQAIGDEDAFTNYLAKHPSGRYVTEAAEHKNAFMIAKVTPEERAMIRGSLEAFFSKAIANQDMEAARAAIPDSMVEFCGKKNADVEAIVQYARDKMAKDVIGLHYTFEQQMHVHKETLPDGNTGFAVEVNVQETISRSDTSQPTSHLYHVTALLNQEQKFVRMNITL